MALSAAATAALIGGISSAATAGIQGASNAIANRNAYKWSKKMFDYQNQYNLANYSPELNMERLRAAGINPHEAVGSASQGLSMQGTPQVPEYQSPIAGGADALARGVQTALNFYAQKKGIDNQTDLIQSQIQRNAAETAKTQFQTKNLLPLEMQYQSNRTKIPLYQIGTMKLQQQKMLNEITLFSMQKQKYQLGIDLMELEKQYHQMADKWRSRSIEYDAKTKKSEAGIRALDFNNYQNFGLRPQDPYYTRIAANLVDRVGESDNWLGRFLRKYFLK